MRTSTPEQKHEMVMAGQAEILALVSDAVTRIEALEAKGERHAFIAKPSKANPSKAKPVKAKLAKRLLSGCTKVYPRVELPEGWKLIPGLNALRTEGYNVARVESPKKDYGYWNREGLLRVQEAIALM